MARRSFVLVFVLLALIPIGVWPSSASGDVADLDLATIDARIHRADRQIHRWYRRIERWYGRIDAASARVERLERMQERPDVRPTDDPVRRMDPRWGDPAIRLARANEALRRILRDPWARRVQAELDTWTAYLAELVQAREQALLPNPAPGGGGNGGPDAGGGGLGLDPNGPISYEAWAGAFLRQLDAPACDENLVIVVTWETAESTTAAYNPLATTRDLPGATAMNTVGVKDYVSARQGLEASRDTLLLGATSYGYDAIVAALRRCAAAAATARAINASAWCRGCVGGTYITGLLPIVRATYDEHAVREISTG